jgi:cytochrome d ubiquinol oxidase subunit I
LALREILEPGTARFRYAVALAVTVGLAAATYRVVKFPNGYWIAMTILIVLFAIAVIAYLRWRRRLYDTRWFACIRAFSSPLPFVAGWTVTELGRQPYIVYGHLRTAGAISLVAPGAVMSSLVLFVIVYTVLLFAFFYAARTVFHGPQVHELAEQPAMVRPGIDSVPARTPAE